MFIKQRDERGMLVVAQQSLQDLIFQMRLLTPIDSCQFLKIL